MRFRVSRTSVYSDSERPCPEATAAVFKDFDCRTFKSPEEHDAKFPDDPWASRGAEHKIIRGPRGGAQGISRRIADRQGWVVDLGSLEELIAFGERHGDLIVSDEYGPVGGADARMPSIEIYDGWRE